MISWEEFKELSYEDKDKLNLSSGTPKYRRSPNSTENSSLTSVIVCHSNVKKNTYTPMWCESHKHIFMNGGIGIYVEPETAVMFKIEHGDEFEVFECHKNQYAYDCAQIEITMRKYLAGEASTSVPATYKKYEEGFESDLAEALAEFSFKMELAEVLIKCQK